MSDETRISPNNEAVVTTTIAEPVALRICLVEPIPEQCSRVLNAKYSHIFQRKQ